MMKYCNNCRQFVEPQKKFNWCFFIILLFTMIGWIIYLIYYICKSRKCPMCKSKNWGVKPHEIRQQTPIPQVHPITEEFKFCSQCGVKIGNTVKFCTFCGVKIDY